VVRGTGLFLGFLFVRSNKAFQAIFIDECFFIGLLFYTSVGGPEGIDENGILVSPPFIINKTETDELLEKLSRSMAETTRLLKI
jgi:4-aminobutyrate aminotransferase-like enzyme